MLALMAEHEAEARERLAGPVADYIASGAGDEVSVGEAEAAWRRHRFAPRVLRDVHAVSTAAELLGSAVSCPVLVAPTGYQVLAHPGAELETATAAARAGSLMVVSTRSTTPFEAIGASGCPWWFQVYVLRDRDLTAALVRRATAAGARALVLTADTPFVGAKRRSPGPLPLDDASYLANLAPHLPPGSTPGEATTQDPAVTPADVGWLAGLSGLPVLVKGVLRPDDALACLAAGASGVVVSNHGGRQLDRAVATADALGPVAAAVGGRGLVLVDGGIRDGLSVLAALALGADGVLLGRPVLWALAARGADGVAAMLEDVRADLAAAMALAGAARLGELDPSLLA